MDNSSNNNKSADSIVKKCKNIELKTRFETIINNSGISHSDFYSKVNISRQYYYYISWGLWNCPLNLKFKIAKILNVDSALIFEPRKELISKLKEEVNSKEEYDYLLKVEEEECKKN